MTPHPRDTDPLAPPHWFQEQLRETREEAYEDGVADGGRINLLAIVIAGISGLIIGLCIHATVFAAAPRSAPPTAHLETPPALAVVSAPSPGPSVVPPPLAAPVVLDDGGGIDSAAVGLSHGRTGIIAQATGHGPDYLAIPIGPGHLVTICGPGDCWTTVSTDGGPNHEMLVAGRIADVAVGHWVDICGVPAVFGLCDGSWIEVDGQVTVPPTDVSP